MDTATVNPLPDFSNMSRHIPYYDTRFTTDDLRRPLRFTNNAISNGPDVSTGLANNAQFNMLNTTHGDAASHGQLRSLQSAPIHLLAENMLRRKTPNGTLNNAYQASMQNLNPSKHVILPYQSGQFVYPMAYSHPQNDSALHQGSMRSLHMVNPLAQGAATAIQLPAQPYGPTAPGINLQGPYGPYYYDGTFAPYQPTAVRDPRFYQDGFYRWNGQQTQVLHHVSQARFDSPQQPQTFDRHQSVPMLPANSYAYTPFALSYHNAAQIYGQHDTDLEPFDNVTNL